MRHSGLYEFAFSLLLTCAIFAARPAAAETTPAEESTNGKSTAQEATPVANRQFVYVLHLVPRLHDDSAWTEADIKAVGAHFVRLKDAAKEGRVILAGKTDEPAAQTFGLVIFEAESTDAAQAFMEEDPAVVAGVMTADLHPYAVAIQRDTQ